MADVLVSKYEVSTLVSSEITIFMVTSTANALTPFVRVSKPQLFILVWTSLRPKADAKKRRFRP